MGLERNSKYLRNWSRCHSGCACLVSSWSFMEQNVVVILPVSAATRVLCYILTKAAEFAWCHSTWHKCNSISSSIFKIHNQECHSAYFVRQTFTLYSSKLLLSMLLFNPAENQKLTTTVSVVGNHTVEASLPVSLMQKFFWFWDLLCAFLKHTYMANIVVIEMIKQYKDLSLLCLLGCYNSD